MKNFFLKRRNYIFFCLLLCSCFNTSKDVVISGNTVIAEVGDVEITVDKLLNEVQFLLIKFRVSNKNNLSDNEKMLLKIKALNLIIRNRLLLMEANLNSVSITQEEYDKAFRQIESGYKEDSFWEYMKVRNILPHLWKHRFENNLLINKFINTKFKLKTLGDEKEAKKYYESHKEQFKKSRMLHAIHIMVSTEDETKVVFKAIKSKNKTFLQLARIYSSASEASGGDNLGYFEVDQMPEEFASITKLKKNQISEAIKTPYGYHIFKIIDIKAPKQLSFVESRDAIFEIISREEQSNVFKKWLIDLKNNSHIIINENVLSKVRL